jgi:penicillin G amidase
MKKLLIVIVAIGAAVWFALPRIDGYQRSGEMTLSSLQSPVKVLRDDNGVPYVYADSLDDALTAQGFLHAQERLFQMELFKYLAHGRLAEFIGERGLGNDRTIRLLDISGFARDYLPRLSAQERNYLQRYLNGVNDYIAGQGDEFPLMVGAMNHEVQPWTLEDLVAIQYFRIWSSSVNWRQELLTLKLIDKLGAEGAHQLRPLVINPDDPRTEYESAEVAEYASGFAALDLSQLDNPYQPRYAMGSNAWATDGNKSSGGLPILSNDPHLDARQLPGFWYPIGMITPELRAVGGSTPGGPGLGLGRNNRVAWGATNGYADMVDLYIETVDPDNPGSYLEGERSIPFVTRSEELLIKDSDASGGYRREVMEIRQTSRGSIISDHGLSPSKERLLSLRWSVPEYMGADGGNRELLIASSVDEALQAIGKTATPLNYIVTDVDGNVARMASGLVPVRRVGDGLTPLPASDQDNWLGRIPATEMPLQLNPGKGWVGSANHRVTDADYPYAFSTHFSGSWRYRRLMELMDKDTLSADDHWAANLDIKNLLATRMLPAMIAEFEQQPELAAMAKVLSEWNYMDDHSFSAPLIFQSVFRHFAHQTFVDELGDELAMDYLKQSYYWQERLLRWYENGESDWFDDKRTGPVEDRAALIRRAGQLALAELTAAWGDDPSRWQWGDAHTITFAHPFFPGDSAAKWLGGGIHPYSGSGETLNRAMWFFDQPYKTQIIDSVRIIVDLADSDKVEAHFPGGTSERLFDSWNKNFLPAWLSGEKDYWWFSDSAIAENARYELLLNPCKLAKTNWPGQCKDWQDLE